MTVLAREHRVQRIRRGGGFALFASMFVAIAGLAVALMAYLMAPRWAEPQAAVESPPLPIVVAGVVFNVPSAAIRMAVQRRAGPQERIDLAYTWPALAPPDLHAPEPSPRLFVTVETAQAPLPAAERLKSIYPRYIDEHPTADTRGLTTAPFADGTPYQGEDLIYDAAVPERFLVRCTRPRAELTPATCLYERAIGAAAVTFRFPRAWLDDWHAVVDGIDRLVAGWRPAGPVARR